MSSAVIEPRTPSTPRTSAEYRSAGSREELLSRARDLVPTLRSRAAEGDALRKLPAHTVRDIKSSGIARVLQSSRYGGCQGPFTAMVDVLSTVGRGCGSTAWCLAQYIGHNFMVTQWPPRAQEAVWGQSPDNLISGILIPLLGRATRIDGGYTLTGQWPFVSGVNNCDWCILSGMVGNAEGGAPEERYFIVPREQITIIPTWDAIGLQGSGSDDIKVDQLFISEWMTLPIAHLKGGETPGNCLHPAPLYRSPSYMWFGILLVAASLGMAEGMLDDYIHEAKSRVILTMRLSLHSIEINKIVIVQE